MNEEMVLDLMRRCMMVAAQTAAPMLLIGMVVGLVIAIFQAATQIQEASLNFVPKLIAIGLLMIVFGPFMIDNLVTFTRTLISEMVYLSPGAPE
ncbi:MAG: flagellar biosynthesis protein FliQ [Myxococcota bacterium]|nr:flagellar biosynthesis protein FliQ [Myxococcota bacterium]